MIIVAGSKLVKDSQYVNDLDIIYVTLDLGKHVVLIKHKNFIERILSEKFRTKITFSPYIPTHTVLGNLFLAITLSRYPKKTWFHKLLLKLSYAKHDYRWLVIHMAFAALGLLEAGSRRDRLKYCSMMAENIVYTLKILIPNSWSRTIGFGYIISKQRGLSNLSALFQWCLGEDSSINHYDKSDLILNALEEYIKKFLGFHEKDFLRIIRDSYNTALRHVHVRFWGLYSKPLAWVACSRLLLLTLLAWSLRRSLRSWRFMERLLKAFKRCKYEIPVLSPLAHP